MNTRGKFYLLRWTPSANIDVPFHRCIVALNRHKNRFGDRWFLSMRSQEDYDNCCRDIQAAQYLISGVNVSVLAELGHLIACLTERA